MLPTHYKSENGHVTPITKMVDEHLANAIDKKRRNGSTKYNDPMFVALEAEKAKRGG